MANPFDEYGNDTTQGETSSLHEPSSGNPFDAGSSTNHQNGKSSNPFNEDQSGGNPFNEGVYSGTDKQKQKLIPTGCRVSSSAAPRQMSAPKRKSLLSSGLGPIDVTVLKEGEKTLILMGFSVKDAQEVFLAQGGSLGDSLRVLSIRTSAANDSSCLWAPPFQLKLSGFEVNSKSGQKPFTEFNISGGERWPSVRCRQIFSFCFTIAHTSNIYIFQFYFCMLAVMPRGSNSAYNIKKRYSQFCDLNASLQADIAALVPKDSGLHFAFVDSRYQLRRPSDEARKEMLFGWLIGIVYDSKLMVNAVIFKKITEFFCYFERVNTDDIIRGVSVPTLFR